MNLFEFIDKVFGSEKQYLELTAIDKDKNFFMFNRMMGIKFPKQANYFNNQDVNKADIIDFWRHFVHTKVSPGKPNFFYTKSVTAPPPEYWEPKDKEQYNKYLEFYEYSKKDFRDSSILDPAGTKKSFKDFQNMLK